MIRQRTLRDAALDAAFARFDADNPHIWRFFEQYALRAIAAGRRHYSAEAILQVIRWDLSVVTRSSDGFKVNNNHRKRYGLKFAAEHPEYADFFETRERWE